jgi:hypothetical protein
MMHTELWLMLLAIGIYLLDSVALLDRNEAMLYRGLKGKWRVAFGLNSWKIRGKEPFIPNPFTPYAAAFRLRWNMEEAGNTPGKANPLDDPAAFRGMGPFASGAAFGLMVLLPIGLFTGIVAHLAVFAIALVYCNVLALLLLMVKRRRELGLSQRQCAIIAFECLVCVPLGVNLVRNLARRRAVEEDLISAAARLLDLDQRAACQRACSLRILDEMDAQPEGSQRMSALQANLQRLRPGSKP